ncbi:1,4-alpha-glucan branching enzyme GlgB [Nakamurella endophytica]|uniref:1,4-alpha-glucan branching enzyme GlgB n=1 Tax=Nakamurella endophytica TaxID=1748367 RepID=A0A917SR52_9ACTN|nr:1,4-alpha-glucan branching protein GlgB [Nakamurella endophytica]GGL90690.1 1,4-alpha-glucan branching enzyme GlgB [Nakamurella endophytica]
MTTPPSRRRKGSGATRGAAPTPDKGAAEPVAGVAGGTDPAQAAAPTAGIPDPATERQRSGGGRRAADDPEGAPAAADPAGSDPAAAAAPAPGTPSGDIATVPAPGGAEPPSAPAVEVGTPESASVSASGPDIPEEEPARGWSPPPGPGNDVYEKVLGGDTADPHAVLGMHPQSDGSTVVRTLRHHAREVTLLTDGHEHPMVSVYGGIWAVQVDGAVGDYRIRVSYGTGDDSATYVVDDPYRWLPTLGEVDLHLIGEGRHEFLWQVLGAHVRTYDTPGGPVTGTSFAVWAPNARGVRVSGDFDHWSGAGQPMRSLGSSGVWELFVPGVGVGTHYKFQILGQDHVWREKADPLAFAAENYPSTASVVTANTHQWGDEDWMSARTQRDPLAEPMAIYELHAGSWHKGMRYREMADALIEELADTGFTHVEFLPLAGHPFGGSWGYQVTSYYAPDPRLGYPDDFRYLVDRLHQAGIGVILDWVPAHFPKDEWALGRFDGTALYEHADPRRGEQPDWGTFVFDFGRREVRNFLVANALYWLEEFHLDGLRVDAVASMLYLDYSRKEGEWLPNQYGGRENLDAVSFLQETNATVGKRVPGAVMIAEESTSWPGVTRPTHLGGLGFHLKWNMGWMHDTLEYISRDPIHRSWHHNELTFSMVYAFSEQFVLPISHDEVVYGKGSLWGKVPGDDWRKAATVRAYLAYMWSHPGKQLLFMGQELGNPAEWNDAQSVPWELREQPLHNGIRTAVGDLNRIYRASPALYSQDFTPAGFNWIDANDRENNMIAYLRWGSDGSSLACVVNFSAVPRSGYRIGLPFSGVWREVLNTDSTQYGGSGVGNMGAVVASDQSWHGQPASASITVPPLGALWLVPESAADH